MQSTLEVLFTPAEFDALKNRDLLNTACVVFDVLRATTSMLTALSNGATQIFPVKEISEAVALRNDAAQGALLAGERNGLRIRAAQSGGLDFDLGNSPREFTAEKVSGRSIIMTTTNGTRALQACLGARSILVGAFLNMAALAAWVRHHRPADLILVGAGTFEEAAYEDTLAAGVLCDRIWDHFERQTDAASIARSIYLAGQSDLPAAFAQHSTNARRLLAIPELHDDVAFALRCDSVPFVPEMIGGAVVRSK
jgi:2-phosphosulfolactate phosphatase